MFIDINIKHQRSKIVYILRCHSTDDETPFCAAELTCYNGIFGSFGDGFNSNAMDSELNYTMLTPTYSAVLPAFGVIILIFIVVWFAMYCYRINYENSTYDERFYVDSQDNNIGMMQMSRFDYDDQVLEEHKIGSNLNQSLLNAGEGAAVANIISPYRIETNYRPNGYTDSSDHGYSTMTMGTTQSDNQCSSGSGSRSNHHHHHHHRRNSISDSLSINTSVSSPHNGDSSSSSNKVQHAAIQPITVLPKQILSPNQIIAEVTVHRIMESA